MKHICSLFLMLALASTSAFGQDEETPIIPVGTLSAFPTIVQTGAHPQLTWGITLPEAANDIIDIQGQGVIVPKRCLIMDIRVLGAPIRRVINEEVEWVATEAQFNYQAQGFSRIFYDTNEWINPSSIVYSQAAAKDTILTFGGRFVNESGLWSDFYSSTNSSHVVALRNGDAPPFAGQGSVETYLLPYLDDSGNVKIGARDVLVVMELTHSDQNDPNFDYQDLALMLTFYDEIATEGGSSDCGTLVTDPGNGNGNNGHGNNADGVDMSNPGNSPHHNDDSDPTIDDENGNGNGRRKK